MGKIYKNNHQYNFWRKLYVYTSNTLFGVKCVYNYVYVLVLGIHTKIIPTMFAKYMLTPRRKPHQYSKL
ncbi:hypothetical protein HanRHA438_Chr15g0732981 [Helianthus annuus]|nr:hypothetical protein HanRHA438_Chr15g0732981 [Helianthus annuus]